MEPAVSNDAQQQHPSLLQLPNALLAHILGHLADFSDLAAAAATCAALHSLAAEASWQRVSQYAAHVWSPALPGSLAWAAAHCPQLRELNLAGATALRDADLLPLRQLSTLTSLSLEGLWRVTGSLSTSSGAGSSSRLRRSGATHAASPAGGSAAQQQQQQLDVLAAIVGSNRGLLSLDIGGTAVPVGPGLAAALAQLTAGAPNATKPAYGLQRLRLAGCGRAAGGQQAALLGRVLVECPALVRLDASGCPWLTQEGVEGRDDEALWAALCMLPLRHVSFAGCLLLGGIGTLVSSWEHLTSLDISGTAVDDADMELIGLACEQLQSLNISTCCRVKEAQLQHSPAILSGRLVQLRLADLAWVGAQHLAPVLRQLAANAATPLRLDLSGCGGLGDRALSELLHTDGPAGGFRELRLGSSGRLTTAALQQLAAATVVVRNGGGSESGDSSSSSSSGEGGSVGNGSRASRPLLRGLEALDLSHLHCLGSKASSAAAASAAATLAALLQAAGSSLRRLVLDGCFAGGTPDGGRMLPLLPRCCPGLEALSLVGCTGVGNDDLAALNALPALRDLAVGGASLAWHEHRALTGLRGLTRLRIARRPFLTDAQLAPLLAANRGSLVQLELAGCASLTDAALLHLLPAAEPAAEAVAAPEAAAEQLAIKLDTMAVAAPGQPSGSSRDAVQVSHSEMQQLLGQQGVHQAPSERDQAHALPPRQQQSVLHRPAPPALEHLQLVCCDRFTGSSLRQLGRLRSLRLGGCPAVTEAAVQAAALCLPRLTLLELPSHIPPSSMPVLPAGAARHLGGLRLLGGGEERRGGRRG
ncbi:hypothetical protein ABPG75_003770 [Micractinium tetrahymenae]